MDSERPMVTTRRAMRLRLAFRFSLFALIDASKKAEAFSSRASDTFAALYPFYNEVLGERKWPTLRVGVDTVGSLALGYSD